MSTPKLINCGQRTVQSMYRVSLRDICTGEKIKVGDKIEVFIKKVKGDD